MGITAYVLIVFVKACELGLARANRKRQLHARLDRRPDGRSRTRSDAGLRPECANSGHSRRRGGQVRSIRRDHRQGLPGPIDGDDYARRP
jgi:hypothetical protein